MDSQADEHSDNPYIIPPSGGSIVITFISQILLHNYFILD